MKRKKYGMNFDLGVPLETGEEYDLLYVELSPGKKQRLVNWVKDTSQGPAIVAGQIGSGKTTFINKSFFEADITPDIKIALDVDVPIYERGAFWGVFLGNVLSCAQTQGCDLSPFHLPESLMGKKYVQSEPEVLANALCGDARSLKEFQEQKKLFDKVDKNLTYIQTQLGKIIQLIENKIQRKLFIYAEGVDKFSQGTSDYESLLELLNFLSGYKTLYEANLMQLVGGAKNGNPVAWHGGKKFILTGVGIDEMIAIMRKRLGAYSKNQAGSLPLLAGLSGGNMRQGLRLLLEYIFYSGKDDKDTKEAIDLACRRVRDDLLNISVASMDPELLKIIHRDKYIAGGLFNDLSTREDARNAIYLNWILISGESDDQLRWPADVNPLLLPAVNAFKTVPESPLTILLREWADPYGMSPVGLDIDISAVSDNQVFDIMGSLSEIQNLNIMEIFDNMAAYFLEPARRDKYIIAYEKAELARLADDLIIGKAGVFKTGWYKAINLDEIEDYPLHNFFDSIHDEECDGYSVFFGKKLTEKKLFSLEQHRDAFKDYKMLWWIPYDHLKVYLKFWPQLRQFFRIFHLEGDLLGSISIEEVEEDLRELADMDGIFKDKNMEKLNNVLLHLQTIKNGK